MIVALRNARKRIARIKPWVENVLQVLDWADWKTWVWYSLLGVEKVTTTLLIWAKRKTQCPARLVYRDGRFYIRGMKKKGSTWPRS